MRSLHTLLVLLAVLVVPATAQTAVQASPGTFAEQSAERPPLLPSAAFAEMPFLTRPLLSPDGRHVAAVNVHDGKERVVIIHLSSGEAQAIAIEEKVELNWFRWAGDGKLLISLGSNLRLFSEEYWTTRLALYDMASKTSRVIVRPGQGLEGDDVLHVDPAGGWILLSVQKSIFDYPSVFRVDLSSLAFSEVLKPRNDVWEWFADDSGVVRLGISFSSYRTRVWYRPTEQEPFKLIAKPRISDEKAMRDGLFDAIRIYHGSDEGYVLSNEETGRFALYRFNYATREKGERIFDNPTNDIQSFETSVDGKSLLSATFTDDRERIHWFDASLGKIQSDIDTALKGRMNWIVSRSRDNKTFLVWTGATNDPGHYYVYNIDAGRMGRLFSVSSSLKRGQLAETRPVRYHARDGLEIPAYLTLPKGRPAKDLPLIVMPHGGPFGVRDMMQYDPEVQFLANRGYAVLQPNYRGSDSYGQSFYEKGFGQWGRGMQDDLDDGMDWLIKEQIIDPKRVCIVGTSYGGYAALWGATRNPERYRCAASFAGISDLERQLKYQITFFISKKYQKDWREKVQGAKDFDLAGVSPINFIDQLQVPVMVVHGDEDQTVPIKQSAQYVSALKKAGKPHEYLAIAGEGHGTSNATNRKLWFDRLEAFLAKHNPP